MADLASLRISVDSRTVKSGKTDLDDLARSGEQAERKLNKSTAGINAGFIQMKAVLDQAKQQLRAVAGLLLAREFIQMADAAAQLNARLKLATDSLQAYAQAQKDVYRIAQQNLAGIRETADLYTKLLDPVKRLGGSQREVAAVTQAFAASLRVSGAGAQQASAAILQFAQAMGSGVLRGDEFNSIAENNPRIMRALADGLGVPIGALREMAAEGKLTADVVGNALVSQLGKLNSEASQIPATVGGAFQQLKNDVMLAAGAVDQAAGITGALADGLSSIAIFIKEITPLLASFGKATGESTLGFDLMAFAIRVVGTAIEAFMLIASDLVFVAKSVGREIGGIGAQIAALMRGDMDAFRSIRQMMLEDAEKARKELDAYQARVATSTDRALQARDALKSLQGVDTGAEDARLLRQAGGYKNLTSTVKELTDAQKEQLKAEKRRLEFIASNGLKGMMDYAKAEEDADKAIQKAIDSSRKDTAEIEKKVLAQQIENQQLGLSKEAIAVLTAEREMHTAAMLEEQAASSYIPEVTANLLKQAEAYKAMARARLEGAALGSNIEQSNAFDQGIGAGLGIGNQFAQGFDQASASLSNFVQGFVKLIEVQEKADNLRKLAGTDQAKLAKVNAMELQAQVNLYGTMAGAAKGFFKEGSTGYKRLTQVEQAFRAVELALAIKNVAVKLGLIGAETGATVAGQGVMTAATVAGESARTAAKVPGIFASFMSMLGPFGIPAAAAAMAAVGIAAVGRRSGGSAAPMNTGTGTVLGDDAAQSKSVTKSLALLESQKSLTGGILRFSEQMAASLRNIETAVGGAASAIVRTGTLDQLSSGVSTGFKDNFIGKLYKPLAPLLGGLFGSQTSITGEGLSAQGQTLGQISQGGFDVKSFVDTVSSKKFFGITYDKDRSTQLSSVDPAISAQFTLILRSFGDAVKAAAWPLGQNLQTVESSLSSFVVDIGRIDLKDLTGEQIQEKLTSVFSQTGDNIARAVLPGLEKFQKVGEGYLETVIRVAATTEAVRDVFNALNVGINVTAERAMSLADVFGSAGALSTALGGFYEKFVPEAERTATLSRNLSEQFKALGLSMPTDRLQFRAEVERALKSGNDSLVASLLSMSDALDKVLPAFEELETTARSAASILSERLGLERELLQLQGDTAALRALDRAAIDKSNVALYDRVNALRDEQAATAQAAQDAQEAAAAQERIAQERIGLEGRLLQLQGNTAEIRRRELEALNKDNRSILEQIYALEDAKAAQEEYNRALSDAQSRLSAAQTAIQSAQSGVDAVRDRGTAQYVSALERVNTLQSQIADSALQIGREFGRIADELFGFVREASQAPSQQFATALRAALGGDQQAMRSLPGLAGGAIESSTASARTATEAARERARILAGVQQAAAIAESRRVAEVDETKRAQDELKQAQLDLTEALRVANAIGAPLNSKLDDLISEFLSAQNSLIGAQSQQQSALEALNRISNNTLQTVSTISDLKLSLIGQLSLGFDRIDTTLDGVLSFDEFSSAFKNNADSETLRAIFNELDTNGDGVLSKLEAIKFGTDALNSPLIFDAANPLKSIFQAIQKQTANSAIQAEFGNSNTFHVAKGVEATNASLHTIYLTLNGLLGWIATESYNTNVNLFGLMSKLDQVIGGIAFVGSNTFATQAALGFISSQLNTVRVVFDRGTTEGGNVYAKGGAFTNSVVTVPTMFNDDQMGEAGPEAIMPLSRGPDGSLGVQVYGQQRGDSDAVTAAEVAALRAEMRQVLFEIAKQSKRSAETLRSWDDDGRMNVRIEQDPGETVNVKVIP